MIVQIVDARNPLGFRSEDLEKYVLELNGAGEKEVEEEEDEEEEEGKEKKVKVAVEHKPKPVKKNLLLINKSDLLTKKQRLVCLSSSWWGI